VFERLLIQARFESWFGMSSRLTYTAFVGYARERPVLLSPSSVRLQSRDGSLLQNDAPET